MTEKDNDEIFLDACKNGDIQKVQTLMETIDNHDGILHDGLCQAASDGNKKLIQVFLDRGVDIDGFGEGGSTPLHKAIFYGHEDVVEFLIDEGATVNYDLDDQGAGNTPLYLAIEKGFLGIVKILVENDADTSGHEFGKRDMPPLCRAIRYDEREIAKYLSENDAGCGCENGCVFEAIKEGSIDKVKFLTENEIGSRIPDLKHAIKLRHKDIAEYLIKEDTFDPSAERIFNGFHKKFEESFFKAQINSLVECIFEAIEQGFEDMLKSLVDKYGCLINMVMVSKSDLQTALHKAVIKGNYFMVKCLIDKGADTKKQDKNHKTPFEIAYEMKTGENMLRLFDEKCPSGRIQMVIEKLKDSYKKDSVILKNFIRDFSIDMTDCHGMSLLHYACKEGIAKLVKDLVELGADVNCAMTRHCSRYYLYKYYLLYS